MDRLQEERFIEDLIRLQKSVQKRNIIRLPNYRKFLKKLAA